MTAARRQRGPRAFARRAGGASRPVNADSGPAKALYVSLMIGGLSDENSSAVAAVEAIGRLSDDVCASVPPVGLNVDLTFHVPGSIVSPDYQGVRTGRYAADDQLLVVQAAVSVPLYGEAARTYMAVVLRRTVELSKAYLKKRKLNLSSAAVETVVAKMLEELPSVQFARE
jgi:hypothetical protein